MPLRVSDGAVAIEAAFVLSSSTVLWEPWLSTLWPFVAGGRDSFGDLSMESGQAHIAHLQT